MAVRPLMHCFQVKLEFGNVGFCGGRKTGALREKPLEQGRERTTNSTHIWRQFQELTWATLVAVHHPCSHKMPKLIAIQRKQILRDPCADSLNFTYEESSSLFCFLWIICQSFPGSQTVMPLKDADLISVVAVLILDFHWIY